MTRSGAGRSPRPATGAPAACWWSAPGAISIRPRVGRAKQPKVDAAPPAVREIAWKAQHRLYRRYRALIRKGKRKTVAIVAIARELAGFIWAVARATTTARAAVAS